MWLDWLDRYLPPRHKSLETIESEGGEFQTLNMSELGFVGLPHRLMKEIDENDVYTLLFVLLRNIISKVFPSKSS